MLVTSVSGSRVGESGLCQCVSQWPAIHTLLRRWLLCWWHSVPVRWCCSSCLLRQKKNYLKQLANLANRERTWANQNSAKPSSLEPTENNMNENIFHIAKVWTMQGCRRTVPFSDFSRTGLVYHRMLPTDLETRSVWRFQSSSKAVSWNQNHSPTTCISSSLLILLVCLEKIYCNRGYARCPSHHIWSSDWQI